MPTPSTKKLFRYKYRDLEGHIFGPFEASQMADWYERDLLHESLLIFRIASTGDMREFELRQLTALFEKPFDEFEKEDRIELPTPELETQRRSNQEGAPNKPLRIIYPSPPFLRLPSPGSTLVAMENAKSKIFSLYQLIITVPRSLSHFPPYDKDTVYCQFCETILAGKAMFIHLVDIQHLDKLSSCIFSEDDVDFWIERIHNVIKMAPNEALVLPGFNPTVCVNAPESAAQFLRRNSSLMRLPLNICPNRIAKTLANQTFFIKVVLDKTSATQYSVSKPHRSKQKFTGVFFSELVEQLLIEWDKERFEKRFGFLIKNYNECAFCNQSFSSFFDVCCHVGSREHRNETDMMLFHDGTINRWVRLLSCPSGRQSIGESSEIVTID